MAKEDYLIRLSMLEQEANKLHEQVQIINQQIQEFEILKRSLEKLPEKGKEILANLGKGIFLKSEIKDKELFVNIGKNVVLKKKPEQAIKIIENQVEELEELKGKLIAEIEKTNLQVQELVERAQEESEKEKR